MQKSTSIRYSLQSVKNITVFKVFKVGLGAYYRESLLMCVSSGLSAIHIHLYTMTRAVSLFDIQLSKCISLIFPKYVTL